jgi:hypothetical protein
MTTQLRVGALAVASLVILAAAACDPCAEPDR